MSPARVTEFTGHAWDSLYRLAGLTMLLLDCVFGCLGFGFLGSGLHFAGLGFEGKGLLCRLTSIHKHPRAILPDILHL